MIKNYPDICAWHRKKTKLHGKSKAHARLRHKIAVSVYYMLKHDKVFDMKRFLGDTKDRAANSAHNRMETPGQSSEPNGLIEKPSGLSKTHLDTKIYGKSIQKIISGRQSPRTTGKRKVLA